MKVESCHPEFDESWDQLVAQAPMATFLHSRRFFAYHRDRFNDISTLLRDDRGRLVGVLPAAVDPMKDDRVTSHPGATYGGLIHAGALYGERMLEALRLIANHYAGSGFRSLTYKAVPHIYQRVPSHDDLYALFRLGATRSRCDLSCTVDLAHRRPLASRRKRGLKKAARGGVAVASGNEAVGELWPILEENLASRHGVRPVHTLAEIRELLERFPETIEVVCASADGELVAGTVLFKTGIVVHAQYIASSPQGMELNALDPLFEHCIVEAAGEGARYFDFGISTTDEGRTLNEGLHEFKVGFGGGGALYEWYELSLGGN